MVDPEPCKELRRRISAAIYGWDCPLLTEQLRSSPFNSLIHSWQAEIGIPETPKTPRPRSGEDRTNFPRACGIGGLQLGVVTTPFTLQNQGFNSPNPSNPSLRFSFVFKYLRRTGAESEKQTASAGVSCQRCVAAFQKLNRWLSWRSHMGVHPMCTRPQKTQGSTPNQTKLNHNIFRCF